jgi:hypothetical protein
MNWPLCVCAAVFSMVAVLPSEAQPVADERVPPEGYVDPTGRYVMPLRKTLANRRLMARDMGKTHASCPETRATLEDIRLEMLKGEGARLEARGFSKTEYVRFWGNAFAEGLADPDPPALCAERLVSWRLMLKNIREDEE